MKHFYFSFFLLCNVGFLVFAGTDARGGEIFTGEHYRMKLDQIASGLSHPWGMALLPDGGILVTERGGSLRLWHNNILSRPLTGVPEVAAGGQGGLLDVVLHPDFGNNHVIYLSYSKPIKGKQTTAVARAIFDLKSGGLHKVQDIFVAKPAVSSRHHYGSRLLFGDDGLLYISVGERGQADLAQEANNHLGSIIRLRDDGSVPDNNPFKGHEKYRPEVFSYGHRNPQGMAWHRDSNSLWIHEHGPKGGDEINQIIAARNFGWPVITYGRSYSGFSIGEGTSKPGMEQPLWYWVPSIAPSGMVNYHGEMFPKWKGNTLVGSLKFAYLERVVWRDGKVAHREEILRGAIGRVRDVREGPRGEIYLLNDESDGGIFLLTRTD